MAAIDKDHQLLKAKYLASVKRTSQAADTTVKKTRMFCQEEVQALLNEDLVIPAQQGGNEEEDEED